MQKKKQFFDDDDDFPSLGQEADNQQTKKQKQQLYQQQQQQQQYDNRPQTHHNDRQSNHPINKKKNHHKKNRNQYQDDKPTKDKQYQNDRPQTSTKSKHQKYDSYQDRDYEKKSERTQHTNRDNYNSRDNYRDNYNDQWTVLMVAEKNSIAKTIAESLCDNSGMKQRKGKCKYCPVYEFQSRIFKRKGYFRLTSVAGHVFTTDFPQNCMNWEHTSPLELFDKETRKKEQNPESKLVDHLIQEAKGIDCLVLWLDNDREGENICFEVISIVQNYMRNRNNIYRAKFSSVTHPDIRMAFNSLDSGPNENESKAVDARQIIDLKVGIPFTRYQTMFFQKKYTDLKDKLITYGPCQTPTLYFCVQRYDEIVNFKPKTYYKLIPKIAMKNNSILTLEYESSLTYNQGEAMKTKNEIESRREVFVQEIQTKDGFIARPEGLNTVNMLKIGSNNLGMGPQQVMNVAEHLYLNGYITYPRTESTSYPKTFEFGAVISALKKYQKQENNYISEYSGQIEKEGISKPRVGYDAGDHPPITPTNKVPFQLNPDELKLYEYIVKHFLGSISQDFKYEKKTVTFMTSGKNQSVKFYLHGTQMKNLGFTKIMHWQRINDQQINTEFKRGDKFQIATVEIKAGITSSPDYLSESDLIGLMEKFGIGTDASMATHINNICERNYVKIDTKSGRKLIPTELGKSMIYGLKQIDPELVEPQLRARIENYINQIAIGKKTKEEVLIEAIKIFKQKFINFTEKFHHLDNMLSKQFGTNEQTLEQSKPFSKCGDCRKYMKYMVKASKLYCETCKQEYCLPENGSKKISGEKTCQIDGFQILLFNPINSELPSYTICPKCYRDNPYKEDKDKDLGDIDNLACYQCPNMECQWSGVNNSIGKCKNCQVGLLILDPPQSNKYSISCNECVNHYLIQLKISTMRKLKSVCPECNYYNMVQLKIMDKENKEFKLCLMCDENTKPFIKQKNLNEIHTVRKKRRHFPKKTRNFKK